MQSGRKYKFSRVDSDITKHLKDNSAVELVDPLDNKKPSEKLEELFRKYMSKSNVLVKVEAFKSAALPGMLIVDESMRRMKDLFRKGPMSENDNPWGDEHTLIVNQSNPAIKKLLTIAKATGSDEDLQMAVDHVYDLAFLQQGKFTAEMMRKFVDRSSKLLERM